MSCSGETIEHVWQNRTEKTSQDQCRETKSEATFPAISERRGWELRIVLKCTSPGKIDDVDFDRSACAIVLSDDLTKELSIEENVEIITRRSKRSLMRCCGVFD